MWPACNITGINRKYFCVQVFCNRKRLHGIDKYYYWYNDQIKYSEAPLQPFHNQVAAYADNKEHF